MDVKSSAIMDSGDYCRVCFALRDHDTSKCPYLQGKEGFVEARNRNFNIFMRSRSSNSRNARRRRNKQLHKNSETPGGQQNGNGPPPSTEN